MPGLAKAGSQALTRRQAALRFLIQEAGPAEASWVYAESGATPQDLRKLAEMGLVSIGETETWRDPLATIEGTTDNPLVAQPRTAHLLG